MSWITKASSAEKNPATDDGVRLRLDEGPARTTVLDGAWWPRSTDVVAELPALVAALGDRRGQLTHVLVNGSEWDMPHPRRADAGGRSVRLGWFTSQPAGLITIMSDFGRDRFDLLVVPPGASRASAEAASSAAADPADHRRTPDLLGLIERG